MVQNAAVNSSDRPSSEPRRDSSSLPAALWLGLDVGTQGTKALLVDVEGQGQVLGRGAAAYGFIEGLQAGHMEQHPSTWIDAVRKATAAALGAAAARVPGASAEDVAQRVKGIGVSGQQHGAVLLDGAYEPVRAAKLWCDTSTAQEAAELSEELGQPIPAGFTAPKIRYVARHEPGLWQRTQHVVLPHDYVNAWLTGELFTEAGDASGTGYLRSGPIKGAADAYRSDLDSIAPGLAGRVPKLVPSGSIAGTLRAAASKCLGLPTATVVSAGGGDNMMSAIGSGATRPGVVTCSLGTSGTVFGYAAAPLMDPTGAIAAFRSSSEGDGVEPGHLPLLCIMNCTGVLNQVCELTGQSHGELTDQATRAVPMGSNGMLFVPYMVGERTPDLPHARGRLSGLSTTLSPGSLYRSALEGVSLSLGVGLDSMRSLGMQIDEVRLVGGAAGNPLWRTILASVFGCPVHLVQETETAALGAALQVASAARGDRASDALAQSVVRFDGDAANPDPAHEQVVAELKDRFRAEIAGY